MTVTKLTITIPEELLRQAKAIAALRGETVSNVIRLALQKYVTGTVGNGADRSLRSPIRWPTLDGGSYSGGILSREEIYGEESSMVTDVDLFPARQRILWRLNKQPPVELRAIRLGENMINLLAEADTGGGIAVVIEAQAPFELEIETEFTTFVEHVPAGRTCYLLTYLDRTDVRTI